MYTKRHTSIKLKIMKIMQKIAYLYMTLSVMGNCEKYQSYHINDWFWKLRNWLEFDQSS